jgi:very-short-patch-repair endonuclease/predicted transcriptional regulator of viral defense system
VATIRNSSGEWAWREVGAVASRQQGIVTRGQLRALGLTDESVSRAIDRRLLYVIFHGVFSVGHEHLTPSARLLAATLACGDGTVVSHGTAAWLYGLSQWKPDEIDVIAPIEAGRKIAGIRRRFVPPPESREVWRRSGVPVTSPARTIVDCAGSDPKGVAGMVEQAAVLGLLDVGAIDRVLDGPRRRGGKHLRRVLEPWQRYRPGIKLRSRLEAKLLPLLTEAALPIPQTNARLRAGGKTYEVDFLWRAEMVVVETDGGRFHDNPVAGSSDSRRNRALTGAGYLIPRLGWEDLRDRPGPAMAELARLLRERRPQ